MQSFCLYFASLTQARKYKHGNYAHVLWAYGTCSQIICSTRAELAQFYHHSVLHKAVVHTGHAHSKTGVMALGNTMLGRQYSIRSSSAISGSIAAYWLSNKLLQRVSESFKIIPSNLHECICGLSAYCWLQAMTDLTGYWTKTISLVFFVFTFTLFSDQAPTCIILTSCFPVTSDSDSIVNKFMYRDTSS